LTQGDVMNSNHHNVVYLLGFRFCTAFNLWIHSKHQGGGKPVHIKMTLFGLYLIRYQPHLSIFESFWFNEESKIWNRACDLKRIADPKSSSNDPVFNLLLHYRSKWFKKE